MSVAAGQGELLGYWGSPCPNGPATHLTALHVSTSGVTKVEWADGPPFSPDTKVELCPYCGRPDAEENS